MASKVLNDMRKLENGDLLNSPNTPVTVISQPEAQNPYVVVNGPGETKEKVGQCQLNYAI